MCKCKARSLVGQAERFEDFHSGLLVLLFPELSQFLSMNGFADVMNRCTETNQFSIEAQPWKRAVYLINQ